MPLSDSAIRALKPRDKDYRVTDKKGLSLQVSSAGGRLWRMKYRTSGGMEKAGVWRLS
ncbi:integrase arm-type DNA-binding domain-containing protein [Novosphingobium sp. 17-62-19]|uniref:integrase arm-type DNA-binding domain-containing protein n=1 Tax=Novosphingobium sp. 17-62-19 TaxID=1970406 RepID=UPI00344BD1AE